MMRAFVKNIIPRFLLREVQFRKQQRRHQHEYQEWLKSEKSGVTPHVVKQRTIKEYKKKSGIGTLVETGTYLGEMVEVQRRIFNLVISVELSPELHQQAAKRFSGCSNVRLLQGDSGKVLASVARSLSGPAIFWLDGHYSGGNTAKGEKECPVYEELDAVFSTPYSHIILIDDARLFVGANDYPTLIDLEKYLRSKRPEYTLTIESDIIRIIPSK